MSRTQAPVTPRWLDETEARAWRAFINGSQRLIEVLNRELVEDHGLGMDDYRILVMLSEAKCRGLRMSELADGVVSSRSRLSHQVRRLEDEGLVDRRECPSDGRGVMAVLTDAGRRRLEQIAPSHVEAVRRHLIDGLSDDELRVLAEVFGRADRQLQG